MSAQVDEDGNTYYLEEVDIEDEEDGDAYEEVEEEFESDEEDFKGTLSKIKKEGEKDKDPEPTKPKSKKSTAKQAPTSKGASVTEKETVVDDFIRNFLIKLNMKQTLDTFNTEWYELSEKGALHKEDIGVVADIYQRNEELDEQVKRLRAEVQKAHSIADKARGTWDKFRKERDFHRMHHRRVVQEKNVLIRDMKRLKKHYGTFEPALQAMREKYETAMKDKMLMKLEKDRMTVRVQTLQTQIKSYEAMRIDEEEGKPMAMAIGGGPQPTKKTMKKKKKTRVKKVNPNETPFPEPRQNPHFGQDYETMNFDSMTLRKTFRGHEHSISGLDIHPTKDIVATASDDRTWKMWSLPSGQLIMSGKGHRDWIGACKFHPKGHMLATASGDKTVKLWDFNKADCQHTFADHTGAVWDCDFDQEGDFLVSASMDQTARLWDLDTGKCRQTFRGHVDSINSIGFQPYSLTVCSGSGDKTVSLWDVRSGLCIQTFYGHENAVLSTAFSLQGDTIASSDSDGVIKVWDIRTVSERCSMSTSNDGQPGAPINDIKFDKSGKALLAGTDLGLSVFKIEGESIRLSDNEITGPEGSVQAVAIDPKGKYMLCAGSESAFRYFAPTR